MWLCWFYINIFQIYSKTVETYYRSITRMLQKKEYDYTLETISLQRVKHLCSQRFKTQLKLIQQCKRNTNLKYKKTPNKKVFTMHNQNLSQLKIQFLKIQIICLRLGPYKTKTVQYNLWKFICADLLRLIVVLFITLTNYVNIII